MASSSFLFRGDAAQARFYNPQARDIVVDFLDLSMSLGVQTIPSVVALAGNTLTPNLANGLTHVVTLDGNLTIANPLITRTNNAKVDTGSRVKFVFVQDATGYRSVTFGAGYKNANYFVPRQGPSLTSAVTFTLNADGTLSLLSIDGIDLRLPQSLGDWGAKGDFVADDTAAVQAMLTYAGLSSYMFTMPQGTYKITSQLNLLSNAPWSPRLYGPSGISFTRSGATLKWAGAAGGTMMFTGALNGAVINGICFDGNYTAGRLLQIGSTNPAGDTLMASSGVVIESCTFYNGRQDSATSYLLCFGSDVMVNTQADSITVRNCVFNGYDGAGNHYSQAAIKTLSAGNCKNFRIENNGILNVQVGIDYGLGSGFMRADGNMFQQIYDSCFVSSTGNLHVTGGGCEDSTTAVPGTTNPAGGMLIRSGLRPAGGPSANQYLAVIEGFYFNASLASDDIGVLFLGPIRLQNNWFWNMRGLATGGTNQFNVVVSGSISPAYGTCISECNLYNNASGYAPILHNSGWNFLDPTNGHQARAPVRSWGDEGGTSGGITLLLPSDAMVGKFTASWTPGTVANGAQVSTTVTAPGAAIGDLVSVGFTQAIPAGALLVGAVTASGTVTVTLLNQSGGNVTPGAGTVKVALTKM